jgi:hypothetical protein
MPVATIPTRPPRMEPGMARKKKDQSSPRGRPSIGKQTNVRLSESLIADLEYIAETLHTDLSHVIRVILAEHIAEYYERAKATRERSDRTRKPKEGD